LLENHAQLKSSYEDRCIENLSRLLQDLTGPVGSYVAMPSELDVSSLPAKLPQITFAYPRISVGDQMNFVLSPEKFTKHGLGFEQPEGPHMNSQALQALLVPGVAFDHRGFRYGMGKGYYDKFLASLPDVTKIGVAFKGQLSLEPLENEEWDIPMDFIVTEEFILDANHFSRAS